MWRSTSPTLSSSNGPEQRSAATRHRRGRKVRAALAAFAAVTVAVSMAPAGAHDKGQGPRLLVDGLAGPLSIDVTARGDVLVGQNFAGVVSLVSKRGEVSDLVTEPGASAVAAGPFGVIAYSVVTEEGASLLKLRMPWGATKVLADLGEYEARTNADSVNSYGFETISEECLAQWPADLGPAQYTGVPDSNPYALAMTPWGIYVADSAANAIVFVDWSGRVRTVAVLPPQPFVVTADTDALGVPACVAGLTYNAEPVPTDIELSSSGAFVSLLPGGPEDPNLGASGSVVKVDLRTGRSRSVAGGFAGATDLAVSPSGELFVAELFGGRVSKVTGSGPVTVAEFNEPVAVEWDRGRLYVAYDAFGSGKLAVVRP